MMPRQHFTSYDPNFYRNQQNRGHFTIRQSAQAPYRLAGSLSPSIPLEQNSQQCQAFWVKIFSTTHLFYQYTKKLRRRCLSILSSFSTVVSSLLHFQQVICNIFFPTNRCIRGYYRRILSPAPFSPIAWGPPWKSAQSEETRQPFVAGSRPWETVSARGGELLCVRLRVGHCVEATVLWNPG